MSKFHNDDITYYKIIIITLTWDCQCSPISSTFDENDMLYIRKFISEIYF